MIDRTPPNDEHAERALLGHVLSLGRLPEGVNGLSPSDFYRTPNATLWAAMITLAKQGRRWDPITMRNYLQEQGLLGDREGVPADHLNDLVVGSPSAIDPAYYAGIIQKHSLRRQMLDVVAGLTRQAFDPGSDLGEVVRRAEERLGHISASLDGQYQGGFKIGSFADIAVRSSTYLLPGVLPDEELVVLVGEEGIGKGLFCVDCIARVTRAGQNVLIIATEDDYERVLKPRLDVAGADTSRCFFMTNDLETLQGQPTFPHNIPEVRAMIRKHNIRLVYIDPWVSSVSGGLRLRDPQDARRAVDPLVSLARTAHCTIIAVAHTNRTEGDLRDKVGLTAELRKAARFLLFALEPPDDDSKIIIGIEMANNAKRGPATVYRKVPHDHDQLPKEKVYALEGIEGELALTIRQWYDRYRPDRDHRVTDRWPEVLAAATANSGLINRADIVAIYSKDGSTEKAADKAITRWLNSGRLSKQASGLYEVIDED